MSSSKLQIVKRHRLGGSMHSTHYRKIRGFIFTINDMATGSEPGIDPIYDLMRASGLIHVRDWDYPRVPFAHEFITCHDFNELCRKNGLKPACHPCPWTKKAVRYINGRKLSVYYEFISH
jgi:hypothetical protein